MAGIYYLILLSVFERFFPIVRLISSYSIIHKDISAM